MTKYAYSPLIKSCNLYKGTSSTGIASAEAASNQCMSDSTCWAVDYECWDQNSSKKITPETVIYNSQIDPDCIKALKDRQKGPPTYTTDASGKPSAKSSTELDSEINYSMVKTFKWWLYWVMGILAVLSVVLIGSQFQRS